MIPGCFKKFVCAVKNHFVKKPKTLRAIQGSELKSHNKMFFCKSEGIQQLFTNASIWLTPYDLNHEENPDFAHLEVSETPVFVDIPKENRSKLDPIAVTMIFVGYSDSHKAYRLIYPESHKLVLSRDVRFVTYTQGS